MGSRQEERSVAIPLGGAGGNAGLALEGLLVAGRARGSGGALIAAPHPLYGGSMDSPVVCELAWACTKAGLASLRFNWHGVGGSGGTPSGELSAAVADCGAALAELAASVEGKLLIAGYSFGAGAALRVVPREPRVQRLVLVAPPPPMFEPGTLEQLDMPVLLVTGERDSIAPADVLASRAAGCAHAEVAQIPDADHFFGEGLAELGRRVGAWLEKV